LIAGLLTACVRAADTKNSSVMARYIMGSFYEKTGDLESAIAEYQAALKQDQQNARIHLSLGSAYLKKNDIPKAIEELRRASEFDPEAVEPHAILALLYFSQEDPQSAGKEYETALSKAAQLDPSNIAIYKSLGMVYLHNKDYAAAENAFDLILKLAPQDEEVLFYLANIYDETGRRDLVEGTLKKALEADPDYAQALNYLGYRYAEEGRHLPEALKLINKALAQEPDNGAYVDSLGWVYFKQGKIRDAIVHLERARTLLEDPVIYDHLGDAYLKLQDPVKAREHWEKSLELDPDNEQVKSKLEKHKARSP